MEAHNRYLDRIEERQRIQLKKRMDTELIFEWIWLICVLFLYAYILVDFEGDLDWRYQSFFIEQLVTMIVFVIFKYQHASKIRHQTLYESQKKHDQYRLIRSTVYFCEIVLMFYIWKAVHFYYNLVIGDNFVFVAIAFGLYAQIVFWGLIMFCFTVPCFIFCKKREPPAHYHQNNVPEVDNLLQLNAPQVVQNQQPVPPQQAPQNSRQQQRTMSLALEKRSRMITGDQQRFTEHIECSICLLEFDEFERVTPLPCDERHYFHTDCIKQWARQKLHCPLCQVAFTPAQLEECNNRLSLDYKDKRNKDLTGANSASDNIIAPLPAESQQDHQQRLLAANDRDDDSDEERNNMQHRHQRMRQPGRGQSSSSSSSSSSQTTNDQESFAADALVDDDGSF